MRLLEEVVMPEGDEDVGGAPVFVDVKINTQKPLGTLENLEALMRHEGVTAKLNIITRRITVEGIRYLAGEEENALYTEMLSRGARYELPSQGLDKYLARIAQDNAYNPVTEQLLALEPPLTNPIPAFVEMCGFDNVKWAEIVCNRWFIQTVAAADHAEKSGNPIARPEFPYVMVIAGVQGLTKTALMYDLLPDSLREYFTAGRMLNMNSKDSVLEATGNWIIELGEVDSTFKQSDIAALKAFLTKQVDDIRMPYAKSWSRLPRCTSYLATVNHLKFLQDTTGNRRFWPLVVRKKIPKLPVGMGADVFAWAWQQYIAGEQWWLTPEEETIHKEVVADHEETPLEDRLQDCYDFNKDQRDCFISGTGILREIGWSNSNRGASTSLGIALTKLGVSKNKREYMMPPRKAANLCLD